MSDRYHTIDNRSYQARLAMSLIATLGQDGAVRACRENCWDGVLSYLLPPEREPAPRER